jgi:hypothetical protein
VVHVRWAHVARTRLGALLGDLVGLFLGLVVEREADGGTNVDDLFALDREVEIGSCCLVQLHYIGGGQKNDNNSITTTTRPRHDTI